MVLCSFCGAKVAPAIAAPLLTRKVSAIYHADRCRNLAHRAKDALRLLTRADVRAYLKKEGML